MPDLQQGKVSPVKLLHVLMAALAAVQFPATWINPTTGAEEASPFAGDTIFDHVKPFDFEDIDKAFDEILTFKNRAAFVILTDEEQRTEVDATRTMTAYYRDTFTVLCCDRSHVNRQLAMTGSTQTPGVLLIADSINKALFGEITINDVAQGFICEVLGGEIVPLSGKRREQQWNRVVWRQVFRLHAGVELRSLSQAAAVTFAAA